MPLFVKPLLSAFAYPTLTFPRDRPYILESNLRSSRGKLAVQLAKAPPKLCNCARDLTSFNNLDSFSTEDQASAGKRPAEVSIRLESLVARQRN